MRIIVLPVGRCRFLEESESGFRFRGTKYGGLRNVRPPIIDPQFMPCPMQIITKLHDLKAP